MLQHAADEMIISSPQIIAPRSDVALRREERYASLRAQERYQLSLGDRSGRLDTELGYTNIHFWKTDATLDVLSEYLDIYHPRYAVLQYWDPGELQGFENSLRAGSTLITRFSQSSSPASYDINGNFYRSTLELFSLQRPGPTIAIYELNYP
jgi:hypothetical protein